MNESTIAPDASNVRRSGGDGNAAKGFLERSVCACVRIPA
jgi:hypothetical protein